MTERRSPDLVLAAACLASLPVVVLTVVALVEGWMPIGDNAQYVIRARDVLTEHHPLVGNWSSGSLAVDVHVNNLGPLWFDLLALPVRVHWVVGTAAGVAAVNVGAIALAVLAARRTAGDVAAGAVALAAAGLCWTLGELLYDPRQHHVLVLPWFALLVLTWSLAAGRTWVLPWVVLVGSFVVQTHLSFVPVVAVVTVVGVLGAVAAAWTDAHRGASAWTERRTRLRRDVAIAGVVGALAWVQPLLDQVGGRGNLSRVVEAAQASEQGAGAAHGARMVAEVVATPPWWLPPSFGDVDPAGTLIGTPWALVALAGVVAALLVLAVLAVRAGDRSGAALPAVAIAGLGGSWLAASSQTQAGPIGLVVGNYRWLWPVAALCWLALALGAGARVGSLVEAHRGGDRQGLARRYVVAALAVGAGVVGVLAAVQPANESVVADDRALTPVARSIVEQLDVLDVEGPVVVERSELFFAEPYTYVLMAGLQARGIEWHAGFWGDELRFGERRAPDGRATGTVWLANGDDALEVPRGARRIAFASALGRSEHAELVALRQGLDRGGEPAEDRDRRRRLEARWQTATVAVLYAPADEVRR